MAFTRETDDLQIISKLADQPNVDDEHDGAWLKAKFDEAGGLLKVYINNTLLAELEGTGAAENIGAATITGLTADNNVQAMLEAIYQIAKDAQAGIVADGSIYPRHLNETFVLPASMVDPNYVAGTDNIDTGAVTTPKLNDGAVTGAKIAGGAVSATLQAVIKATVEIEDETVSAWSYDGPPYMQEVEVPGLVPEVSGDATTTVTWTVNSSDPDVIAAYDLIDKAANTDAVIASTDAVIEVDVPIIALQNGNTHLFTVPANGWIATGQPMKQVVTATGLLASDTPIVDMIPSDTWATAEQQIEAYGYIYRMVAGDDTLTCYAKEETLVDVPIQIKAVRK